MTSQIPFRSWRAISMLDRAPRILAFMGAVAASGAMRALGYVADAAGKQPVAASQLATHPYFYKGTWRYITDRQAAMDHLGNIVLPTGMLLALVGVVWAATVEVIASQRQRDIR